MVVMMVVRAVMKAMVTMMEVRAVMLEITAVSGPCEHGWVLSAAMGSEVRKAAWVLPRCTSW